MSVSIIGLGYIGLPTAVLVSSKGIKVHGVDINLKRIDEVISLQIDENEPNLKEELERVLKNGLLTISTKVEEASTYIIVVPTPFKKDYSPDISFVFNALESIIPFLKKNDLIVLESTSPVGTTKKMMEYVYSKRVDLNDNVFFAYCPERVLPGNIFKELVNNSRIIGGVNLASTKKAIDFYEKFVLAELTIGTAEEAEMVKLVENTSRDVQIAFANELSIICDEIGLNAQKIIEIANKHPRVSILNPGVGVGGHCIAVDPHFIISSSPNSSVLIKTARFRNIEKTNWVLSKCVKIIESLPKQNLKIALLGTTYKPNVSDERESPAKFLVDSLIQKFSPSTIFSVIEPNISLVSKDEIQEIVNSVDFCFKFVAHKEFDFVIFNKEKFVDFS